MEWPALAELARDAFPEDVIARARELQSEIGSIGAYSHSQGVPFIRKNVARFIEGQSIVTFAAVTPAAPPRARGAHFPKLWKLMFMSPILYVIPQSAMAIHRTRTTSS